MTFATIKEPVKFSSKTQYLRIISGLPVTIQIMDTNSTSIGKHWITDGSGKRIGLTCAGSDTCVICRRNAEIGYNRENPDFVPLQNRYRVNVLDLTPVKICPKCEAVYHGRAVPVVCSGDGCNTNLSEVVAGPLNEVKILERGRTLMEQFNAFEEEVHPATGKVEPLQSFSIMLIATGSGKNMVIAAIPQAPTGIDLSQYEKFDLNQGLQLDNDEIRFLLTGGSLSDVLSARKAEAATVVYSTGSPVEGVSTSIPF